MTDRIKDALKSTAYSKAFKRALREFARMDQIHAHFEVRFLALLITEDSQA